MFNNIFKFLSRFNISVLRHAWKIKGIKYFAFCCLSAVFIIFIYGGIKFFLAGDEVSKFSGGTINSGDGLVNSRPLVFIPMLTGVEAREFVKNFTPKNITGIIESFFFSPAFAEDVSKESAKKRADKSQNKSNNQTSNIQLASLLVGYVLGLLVFAIGLFIFTQQCY